MKILVVDDEKEIVSILRELIEARFVCDVDCHYNGLDAFIACQKTKYDLIISDHKMPFMMGSAFIIATRTRENLNSETPVVLLSGFIDDDLKNQLLVKKVEFVSKPFEESDLLELLSHFLN